MTFDQGQERSRNDLEYSHPFIYLTSCLHLSTYRSQAAIVSENSLFSFTYKSVLVTKFDLAEK